MKKWYVNTYSTRILEKKRLMKEPPLFGDAAITWRLSALWNQKQYFLSYENWNLNSMH